MILIAQVFRPTARSIALRLSFFFLLIIFCKPKCTSILGFIFVFITFTHVFFSLFSKEWHAFVGARIASWMNWLLHFASKALVEVAPFDCTHGWPWDFPLCSIEVVIGELLEVLRIVVVFFKHEWLLFFLGLHTQQLACTIYTASTTVFVITTRILEQLVRSITLKPASIVLRLVGILLCIFIERITQVFRPDVVEGWMARVEGFFVAAHTADVMVRIHDVEDTWVFLIAMYPLELVIPDCT